MRRLKGQNEEGGGANLDRDYVKMRKLKGLKEEGGVECRRGNAMITRLTTRLAVEGKLKAHCSTRY